MKLELGYGSQTFRISLEGEWRWYHKDAKKIKRGIVYRHMLSYYWTASVDNREIYTIEEKDRHTSTHWLVKHKVLNKEAKLEFIPLQQVYLDELKDKQNGYWTIKLSEYTTVWGPREIDDFHKKIEGNKKKKK